MVIASRLIDWKRLRSALGASRYDAAPNIRRGRTDIRHTDGSVDNGSAVAGGIKSRRRRSRHRSDEALALSRHPGLGPTTHPTGRIQS
jgi:hypothetical protein